MSARLEFRRQGAIQRGVLHGRRWRDIPARGVGVGGVCCGATAGPNRTRRALGDIDKVPVPPARGIDVHSSNGGNISARPIDGPYRRLWKHAARNFVAGVTGDHQVIACSGHCAVSRALLNRLARIYSLRCFIANAERGAHRWYRVDGA